MTPTNDRRQSMMTAAVAAADARMQEELDEAAERSRTDAEEVLARYYREVGRALEALTSSARPTAPAVGHAADTLRLRIDRLPPRTREVLDRLLTGDSEKQAAIAMGISRHTVHDHVKVLYRSFDVASRGELLALFVARPDGSQG